MLLPVSKINIQDQQKSKSIGNPISMKLYVACLPFLSRCIGRSEEHPKLMMIQGIFFFFHLLDIISWSENEITELCVSLATWLLLRRGEKSTHYVYRSTCKQANTLSHKHPSLPKKQSRHPIITSILVLSTTTRNTKLPRYHSLPITPLPRQLCTILIYCMHPVSSSMYSVPIWLKCAISLTSFLTVSFNYCP